MTKEDIIRMAREAREQVVKTLPPRTFDLDLFHERFAALVAAAEREQCAKVCEELAERFHAHAADCAAAIRARGQA
jgi:hypothetical protein